MSDDLRDEFVHADSVLPEVVLALRHKSVFHRQDPRGDDVETACRAQGEWDRYRREDLDDRGFRPCRGCFAQTLEHLATLDSSKVAFRDVVASAADGGSGNIVELPDTTSRPVDSLTADVLTTTPGVLHAPGPNGEPLCGQNGSYVRWSSEGFPSGSQELCRHCFTEDVSL